MSEQMEIRFEIQPFTPPPAIEFNYEEIKEAVTKRVTELNSIVVTEESIKDAKALKADLNRVVKEMDAKRIEIKKAYSVSITEFENQVKEITTLMAEPVKIIDTQLKEFEEQVHKKKYAQLALVYGENIGKLIDIVSLDSILNPKWKNAGEKVEKLSEEIKETIKKIGDELALIDSFGAEFALNCKDTYIKSGYDLSKAMAEKVRIEERKRQLEEYEKNAQEEKAKREAEKQAEAEKVAAEVQALKEMSEPVVEVEKPVVQTPVKPVIREVKVVFHNTTPEFRAEMFQLIKKHNIKFESLI